MKKTSEVKESVKKSVKLVKLSYEDAKALVQKAGISSIKEYYEFYQTHHELLTKPDKQYAGWEGWPTFLNVDMNTCMAYAEAKTFVGKASLKNASQYYKFYAENKKHLPCRPDKCKAWKKDWKSWNEFLGVKPVDKTPEVTCESEPAA